MDNTFCDLPETQQPDIAVEELPASAIHPTLTACRALMAELGFTETKRSTISNGDSCCLEYYGNTDNRIAIFFDDGNLHAARAFSIQIGHCGLCLSAHLSEWDNHAAHLRILADFRTMAQALLSLAKESTP